HLAGDPRRALLDPLHDDLGQDDRREVLAGALVFDPALFSFAHHPGQVTEGHVAALPGVVELAVVVAPDEPPGGSGFPHGGESNAVRHKCQAGIDAMSQTANERCGTPRARAASGAGFTPAERAGGRGGAPLAPPSSKRTGAGFTPAERAGGVGGALLAPPSSKRTGAGFTPPGDAKRPRKMSGGEFTSPPRKTRAGGLGGAPLAPPSSLKPAGFEQVEALVGPGPRGHAPAAEDEADAEGDA